MATTAVPHAPWGLVGGFAVIGALHLVTPRHFEAIVPRRLPAKRQLVYASGVVELGCAAGLACPPTRRTAGLVSCALLAAVFPANLQMTADIFRGESSVAKALAVARLPLQLPLMQVAWRTWRARPCPGRRRRRWAVRASSPSRR